MLAGRAAGTVLGTTTPASRSGPMLRRYVPEV